MEERGGGGRGEEGVGLEGRRVGEKERKEKEWAVEERGGAEGERKLIHATNTKCENMTSIIPPIEFKQERTYEPPYTQKSSQLFKPWSRP